ncbi:MAG: alpha/beta hydrolase, partial [Alphaproteobacteria bacterium]
MVIVILAACSPGRTVEAVMVLADVAAVEKSSRLKATRPKPQRRPISYVVADRTYHGDLYRPGDHAIAALVLVPGAARRGKDHPRLVAFAESLARARFTVLVPDIENLRALHVDPADARHIADAVQYLSGTTTDTGYRPVGIVAISYAAGPALLAALRPETRDRVGFVLAIGGYYDIEAVITFFTTGHYRRPGEKQWRRREPNAYGKWVFVKSNARRLSD